MAKAEQARRIERWGMFELELAGPDGGNAFVDTELGAEFESEGRRVEVAGFYDGEGVYKVRFMPGELGLWRYRTRSNSPQLDGKRGEFICAPESSNNHGPVRVANRFHFAYADGTPFFVMGTTAYAWTYRPDSVRRKTLESFARYGFNKVRMLVLPKHYGDEQTGVDISYEPPWLPFAGEPGRLDFERFNVQYFRNFEARVEDLLALGIQADVILFHVYDFGQWGIPEAMTEAHDFLYLRYAIARLAAYRNLWWSLANEYDLFGEAHPRGRSAIRRKDWDAIGSFVRRQDPYRHLCSIHNWPFATVDPDFGSIYPDRDWLTHVSYQSPNTYSLLMHLKRDYGKPVIDDEYQYEGNVNADWGNCSAEQEVFRHWLAVMAGGYASHGEAFVVDGNKKDIFWSYGGELVGGAPQRLKFMRDLLESCPFHELEPDLIKGDGVSCFCLKKGVDFYLYFITGSYKDGGRMHIGPADGGATGYEATLYDAWNCRLLERRTIHSGPNRFDLPRWAVLTLDRQR